MTWPQGSLPRLTDARQALKCVRSGYRVWIEPGCATPTPLVEALVERAAELRDVEVVHMLTFGEAPYTRPEFADTSGTMAFSWATMFAKPYKRAAPITLRSSWAKLKSCSPAAPCLSMWS